ncbi:hypothetical protein LK994_09490 [Ferruginibacter lapsinanis]|uniref:baeRF3 domain-containing protein n=1 Tax=Ferruginibacter lapsinanis TaxID=563172 RepID=UPI001E57151C|nr:hypothetical protein [Ferruginibacter lapsinanis]UEG48869.1 hypothetical protein LK994_09490 [Ferruginibacter lapsinanis]
MFQELTEQHSEVKDIARNNPCISLVMPFEPKMTDEEELVKKVESVVIKIEKALLGIYPEVEVGAVVDRLKEVLEGLNYFTHKKSIAVFVSPIIDKIYYLDMQVDEKIIIDGSFAISDVINCKKQMHEYLVGVFTGKYAEIYLGDTVYAVSNVLNNDWAQREAVIDGNTKLKKILLDKFSQSSNHGIKRLLQAYKLPFFMMGSVNALRHFKTMKHNVKHVVKCISGNFKKKTPVELQAIIQQHVVDWHKVIQADLISQIEEAKANNKIAIGINEVKQMLSQNRGKLLIVEKDFICRQKKAALNGTVNHLSTDDGFFYIKNGLDELIEQVLENGGDVEFVDKHDLKKYHRIVLIENFDPDLL